MPITVPRLFFSFFASAASKDSQSTSAPLRRYSCDLRKDLKTPDGSEKLHRVNWMPRPRVPTAKGYAKFMSLPSWPVTAYLACTSLFTKLPAFRNAKISDHWPDEEIKEQETAGMDDEGSRVVEDLEAPAPAAQVEAALRGTKPHLEQAVGLERDERAIRQPNRPGPGRSAANDLGRRQRALVRSACSNALASPGTRPCCPPRTRAACVRSSRWCLRLRCARACCYSMSRMARLTVRPRSCSPMSLPRRRARGARCS